MYDVIYDVMLKACIASERHVSMYTNREGKEVGVGERFGSRQDIKVDDKH